jgi:hypothetical protein
MKKLKVTLTLLALVCITNMAKAQSDSTSSSVKDTSTYIILTNDGGEFIGKIESDDGRELKLMTIIKGVVIVPKYAIKSMTKANQDNLRGGEYFFENPHASRYFYTPTGYGIQKGTGYVQTIWGLYYQLQYGVTDNFSIGVSTSIFGTPITLTPKYSFEINPKLHLAIGAQVGTETYTAVLGEPVLLGIGYASLTTGSKEDNVTFGLGYAGATFDGDAYGGPAVSIAGVTRLAKKLSLMGEFWILPSEGIAFGGPGLRIMRKKENILDVGFWVFGFEGEFVPLPIPFVSFTWAL